MIVEGKSAFDAISVKEKMRKGPFGFLVNRQRPQSEANVKMKSRRKITRIFVFRIRDTFERTSRDSKFITGNDTIL